MPVTLRNTDILMNSGSAIQDPPGGAPGYVCRAWVNFNGQGSVSIRASGNVSSISDNGVGDYTVNFSSGMPDASFSSTVSISEVSFNRANTVQLVTLASGSVRFTTKFGDSAVGDPSTVCVSILR